MAWQLNMSEDTAKQFMRDLGVHPVVQRGSLVLWDARDVYEARDLLRARAGLASIEVVGHIAPEGILTLERNDGQAPDDNRRDDPWTRARQGGYTQNGESVNR